jgi:tRNA (guanine-N7-)-methyltransferase
LTPVRSSRRPPLAELQPYLLDLPHPRRPGTRLGPLPTPLAWAEIFGNDHPVEIEVGFGKGLFLLNRSQARPQVNFLGIEIERKYVLLTAARLLKHQRSNVRLACTDARWLFSEGITSASVAAVHVYFPDPWWKQRHRKRRLFTPEFAEQSARVLMPGGRLHFVSDVQAYFEESVKMLADQSQLQRLADPPVDGEYLTNFERKYRQEGRPIYRSLWQRP